MKRDEPLWQRIAEPFANSLLEGLLNLCVELIWFAGRCALEVAGAMLDGL